MMAYHPDDTICAIASAPAGAARGIVRVSGPDAVAVVSRCFLPHDDATLANLTSACAIAGQVRTALRMPAGETNLRPARACQREEWSVPCDAFVWPTARSYTREPVVELHTLGSPPLLEAIVASLCRAGARLAEPGEFTLRAFLAGRIDLTQAEAVLGVIDARGQEELDAALSQLAGGLARPLTKLRGDLLQLLAELEAGLDFAEEDIEFTSPAEVLRQLDEACQLLDEVAQQMAARHAPTGLHQVALVGAPNVGKSSLFNVLAARFGGGRASNRSPASPAALVSAQRGTTRDYLTATICLDGMSFEIVDTAGIAEADDVAADESQSSVQLLEINRAARALAEERRSRATIRAHCVVGSDFARLPHDSSKPLPDAKFQTSDIIVLTKCDLLEAPHDSAKRAAAVPVIPTSSRTGEGLDELCAVLRNMLSSHEQVEAGSTVAATAERCRESIRLAAAALRAASDTTVAGGGSELLAVEIRAALDELGKVVGAIYTDDLLDRIFSTFCIGK